MSRLDQLGKVILVMSMIGLGGAFFSLALGQHRLIIWFVALFVLTLFLMAEVEQRIITEIRKERAANDAASGRHRST